MVFFTIVSIIVRTLNFIWICHCIDTYKYNAGNTFLLSKYALEAHQLIVLECLQPDRCLYIHNFAYCRWNQSVTSLLLCSFLVLECSYMYTSYGRMWIYCLHLLFWLLLLRLLLLLQLLRRLDITFEHHLL